MTQSTSVPEPRYTSPSSVHATPDLLRFAFGFRNACSVLLNLHIRASILAVQLNKISGGFLKWESRSFWLEIPSPYQNKAASRTMSAQHQMNIHGNSREISAILAATLSSPHPRPRSVRVRNQSVTTTAVCPCPRTVRRRVQSETANLSRLVGGLFPNRSVTGTSPRPEHGLFALPRAYEGHVGNACLSAGSAGAPARCWR